MDATRFDTINVYLISIFYRNITLWNMWLMGNESARFLVKLSLGNNSGQTIKHRYSNYRFVRLVMFIINKKKKFEILK